VLLLLLLLLHWRNAAAAAAAAAWQQFHGCLCETIALSQTYFHDGATSGLGPCAGWT